MKFYQTVYTDDNDSSVRMPLKEFDFLSSHITEDRKGYTCRACQEKVLDKTKMWTDEPHSPTYHIRCYEFIYNKMIGEITSHKNNLTLNLSAEDIGELEITEELREAMTDE